MRAIGPSRNRHIARKRAPTIAAAQEPQGRAQRNPSLPWLRTPWLRSAQRDFAALYPPDL